MRKLHQIDRDPRYGKDVKVAMRRLRGKDRYERALAKRSIKIKKNRKRRNQK